MERVFANLYRIGGAQNRRGSAHSYLLVRKEGNLFVCHQSGPSPKEIAEIKRLGGIESQWICHHHDANREDVHEDLHKRFGCALHHHSAERAAVRKKTKCPNEQFGDEGIQHGTDFEGLFFPSCTAGHTVYRWKHRGKYFLFPSHAMNLREDKWEFGFNPWRVGAWGDQVPKLARLEANYVFPGYTGAGEDAFYRLNDQTRRSLARGLRAKLKSTLNRD